MQGNGGACDLIACLKDIATVEVGDELCMILRRYIVMKVSGHKENKQPFPFPLLELL